MEQEIKVDYTKDGVMLEQKSGCDVNRKKRKEEER
jgi:hypothetical protein